jgi:pimeloyl-ACP methyl ester carboxylesterase
VDTLSSRPGRAAAARRSRYVDVDGPVHVVDFGGPADAPVVLCVHGLGGSATGWAALARALTPSYRVLAVDLPGHGRSPATGRPLSVEGLSGVLQAVIARLGIGPVVLVGHSMGAVVSILATVAAPSSVERLLLLAPPLPRQGLSVVSRALLPHVALCLWPRIGLVVLQRRVARQSLEEYVWDRLRLTCGPTPGLREVAEELAVELQAAFDRGEDPLTSFVQAARSVGLLVAGGRGYREAIGRVDIPVQVVHGASDRVLNPTTLHQLEELQPGWQTHVLPDVGHSPHLEAPATVARLLGSQPVTGVSGSCASARPRDRSGAHDAART